MLAVSTGFWISVPRYVLTMFPLFLALGLISTKKPVSLAIVAISCAGLFFFTWLFATGTGILDKISLRVLFLNIIP
jgi:uncharacterized membrane protein